MRNYREGRRTLVVYGAGDPLARSKYEELSKRLFSRRSSWRVRVQSDRETTYDDLKDGAAFLIGTSASNRWIEVLSKDLPVSFQGEGFRFLDETYREPNDILRLVYPNPANPRLPLFLTTGNSDEQLAEYLEIPRRGDYQVLRNGMTLAMGSFKQSASGAWVADPTSHRSFKPEGEPALSTEHYEYCVHFDAPDEEELRALAEENEAIYRRAAGLLGLKTTRKLRYHVYVDGEEKGLITHNTEPAHLDPVSGDVHAVIEADRWGLRARRTAEQLLRRRLGKPSHRLFELGLAAYLAEIEDYEYWSARLSLAESVLPLDALLDDEMLERESDFIVAPLARSFVGFLLEKKDFDLESHYAAWNPSPSELERLESEWRVALARRASGYRVEIDKRRAAFPLPAGGFQKGFTHAHEGYEIFNGYLSKRSDDALRKLASMGTDSVAIVPYTFMRDPATPAPLPIPESTGSENDEGVIHSIRASKALGLTVMLKPQIWLRGGWPGDIEMATEKDRQAFFAYYYRWIRHYALMAEVYDVEIFCIGTELMKMTKHDADWVEMIEAVRKLYSGKLVYAANWDREFDRITFWDRLDYIGVNAYYPLSNKGNPSEDELSAGFDRALEQMRSVHERYKKPVLVTEIGFTSTAAPWRRPHESGRRKPVNLLDQARSYEVVLQGLKGSAAWIRGVYWWKWPSDLEHGGREHTGFTPNGKPAEDVVRKWYRADW